MEKEMENQLHQEICRDKYHKYLKLASELPNEMKKRGVFRMEEWLFCPKNKKNVEKGPSGCINTPIIFYRDGNISRREIFGADPISISDIEGILKEFFFISPENLTEVPQLYMSELESCISKVYNNLHKFDSYLEK